MLSRKEIEKEKKLMAKEPDFNQKQRRKKEKTLFSVGRKYRIFLYVYVMKSRSMSKKNGEQIKMQG